MRLALGNRWLEKEAGANEKRGTSKEHEGRRQCQKRRNR
jgi:hypothetical protein